jgi:pheromone a factor receptor
MESFEAELNTIHPLAIVMPTLAAIAVTLCIPPFIWHLSNRNVGAVSLMLWLIILNFMNFINALIWPNDNIFAYWNGEVFCDIEIRLMLGGTVAVPSAVLCIVRDLARALDTNRNTLSFSESQKKRKLIIDLLLCFGMPLYFIGIYYIVQPGRYYIYAIQGCWYPIDESWVSIVLIVMWPLILTLIAAYFAGMCSASHMSTCQ